MESAHAQGAKGAHSTRTAPRTLALACTRDGRTLAVGYEDKNKRDQGVVLWQLPGRRIVGESCLAREERLRQMDFTPDDQTLVLACKAKRGVIVWDAGDRRERIILGDRLEPERCLAVSPDVRTAAAGGRDGKIRLWNLQTGRVETILEGHQREVQALAFQPGGNWLASGGRDGTVRLWSLPNGEEVRNLSGKFKEVRCLAFSPDGRTLATSHGGNVILWNIATGVQRSTLKAHKFAITALVYLPDGHTLATAGWDRTVKLWDLQHRRVMPPPPAPRLAATPDKGHCRQCSPSTTTPSTRPVPGRPVASSCASAASALGGLTLPGLLAARAEAAKAKRLVKDVSVVLLFLQGGPAHIELFDPKMTAPAEIRSSTGEVQTALPGITFGGTFPKLAKLANKLAVVRSYASMNAGHTYNAVASGGNSFKAAMSAVYARIAGTNHPRTGMPRNVLLVPEAVEPALKLQKNFETGALPTLTSPGELGAAYTAFDPASGGQLLQNLKLRLPPDRFADRRRLLAAARRLQAETGRHGGLRRRRPRSSSAPMRCCSRESPTPSTCRRRTRKSSRSTTPATASRCPTSPNTTT